MYEMLDFPGAASGKELACQCRRCKGCDWIPGPGRSPGGAQGNPLQYSCLENPMDRGAWWATVHGVTKNQTQQKQLRTVQRTAREMLVNSMYL